MVRNIPRYLTVFLFYMVVSRQCVNWNEERVFLLPVLCAEVKREKHYEVIFRIIFEIRTRKQNNNKKKCACYNRVL